MVISTALVEKSGKVSRFRSAMEIRPRTMNNTMRRFDAVGWAHMNEMIRLNKDIL